MVIGALKNRRRRTEAANRLCAAVLRRARDPQFYNQYGIADSIDGRFDLVALHAWLVLERLRESGETALAQGFVDALFARFDEALREQGAGDIGMSRRMKKIAGAFYGRLRAYSACSDENALTVAILRNVYRGEPSQVDRAALLANYSHVVREGLAGISSLPSGDLTFAPLPAPR